mgnify:CR=1 FL=1
MRPALQGGRRGCGVGGGKTVVYVSDRRDGASAASARVLVVAARPGRGKDVIDGASVFGRPRHVETVKSSPQYGELFGRVWGLLRDEVIGAQAAEGAAAGIA